MATKYELIFTEGMDISKLYATIREYNSLKFKVGSKTFLMELSSVGMWINFQVIPKISDIEKGAGHRIVKRNLVTSLAVHGRVLFPESEEDLLENIDLIIQNDPVASMVEKFDPENVENGMIDQLIVLKGKYKKEVLEILEWMPEAFVKAHEEGKEAENKDMMDEGNQLPNYDGDDDTWRIGIYYSSWRTENGILYETIESGDMDGNTPEYEDEAEVGTPEWEEMHRTYYPPDPWGEYYEYCAASGLDPLDQIMVPRYIDHHTTTEFEIGPGKRKNTLILMGWRIKGEGAWIRDLARLEDDLLQFVNGKMVKGEIVLQDFRTYAQLLAEAQAGDIVERSGFLYGEFTETVSVEIPDEDRAAEIRRIAARRD